MKQQQSFWAFNLQPKSDKIPRKTRANEMFKCFWKIVMEPRCKFSKGTYLQQRQTGDIHYFPFKSSLNYICDSGMKKFQLKKFRRDDEVVLACSEMFKSNFEGNSFFDDLWRHANMNFDVKTFRILDNDVHRKSCTRPFLVLNKSFWQSVLWEKCLEVLWKVLKRFWVFFMMKIHERFVAWKIFIQVS